MRAFVLTMIQTIFLNSLLSNNLITNVDLPQLLGLAAIIVNGICSFIHNLKWTEMRKKPLLIAFHSGLNK